VHGDVGFAMRRKKFIISGILLALVIVLASTGGIYIYTGPQYKFQRKEKDLFLNIFILNTRSHLIL